MSFTLCLILKSLRLLFVAININNLNTEELMIILLLLLLSRYRFSVGVGRIEVECKNSIMYFANVSGEQLNVHIV